MLKFAHACENNDVDTLSAYSQRLDIPLHQISVSYLDALIAASALDPPCNKPYSVWRHSIRPQSGELQAA